MSDAYKPIGNKTDNDVFLGVSESTGTPENPKLGYSSEGKNYKLLNPIREIKVNNVSQEPVDGIVSIDIEKPTELGKIFYKIESVSNEGSISISTALLNVGSLESPITLFLVDSDGYDISSDDRVLYRKWTKDSEGNYVTFDIKFAKDFYPTSDKPYYLISSYVPIEVGKDISDEKLNNHNLDQSAHLYIRNLIKEHVADTNDAHGIKVTITNEISAHNTNVLSHENRFSTKANLDSPEFTGIPKVPTPDIDLDKVTDNDLNVVNLAYLKKYMSDIPIGTIMWWSGGVATIPAGWLFCNGQEIKDNIYPELYAIVGSTVPNLIGRYVKGSTRVEYGDPALPNIKGSFNAHTFANTVSGAFSNGANGESGHYDSGATMPNTDFDASKYNPIYKDGDAVDPKHVTLIPIIKAINGTGETVTNNDSCTNVRNDLTTLINEGITKINETKLGLPDYTAGVALSTAPISYSTAYVAPSDGFFWGYVKNNVYIFLKPKSVSNYLPQMRISSNSVNCFINIPLNKGDSIFISVNTTGGQGFILPNEGWNPIFFPVKN